MVNRIFPHRLAFWGTQKEACLVTREKLERERREEEMEREMKAASLRTCLGYPGLVNPIPRIYSIPFNGHSKWIDSIRSKMNGFPLWLRHSIYICFFSPHDHLWFTILPPCKYHKLAITIIDKHLEKAFHWLIASVDGVNITFDEGGVIGSSESNHQGGTAVGSGHELWATIAFHICRKR